MIDRYSSRNDKFNSAFLKEKLTDAVCYDRIAGYFCSSILEIAGEALENVTGEIRIICNSTLDSTDIKVAQLVRKEWCEFRPESKVNSPAEKTRFALLYKLLMEKKLHIRVIPNDIFGLLHGKAGNISYRDNSKICFVGSANETASAYTSNYEIVWTDTSAEGIAWTEQEFDFFWSHRDAVELSDVIIEDIGRIAHRSVVDIDEWRNTDDTEDQLAQALVEEDITRFDDGLWPHQKYFVAQAFKDHKSIDGAHYILADKVGLGKTIQMGMTAKLMAMYGNLPILILAPKTLLSQWQDELWNRLRTPSAVWNGYAWVDELGMVHRREFKNCPRRIGIVSSALVMRDSSPYRDFLLSKRFECVICDEAHKARRRNLNDELDARAVPNNLLSFLNRISKQTHSMILGTATPIQLKPIEAYDLLHAAAGNSKEVLGSDYSEWNTRPGTMLEMVCGRIEPPDVNDSKMWDIMRNPVPNAYPDGRVPVARLRKKLWGNNAFGRYYADAELFRNGDKVLHKAITDCYTEGFIQYENPYIRHIICRTREALESAINPDTGKPYLQKIEVNLYGEKEEDSVKLNYYQKQAYDKARIFCEMVAERSNASGFLLSLIQKRIGSTVSAGLSTCSKLLEARQCNDKDETFKDELSAEDDEANINQEIAAFTNKEVQILRDIVDNLRQADSREDPKIELALKLLTKGIQGETGSWLTDGCIVFSQYLDSAEHAALALSEKLPTEAVGLYAGGSDNSGIFQNGEFSQKTRDDIKKLVQQKQLRLLIGTDAASEGLNLQTLGNLVNLDLPWNPIRLEQRKGRIQRIGQRHSYINIYNMRYAGSVEDRVHAVLSERTNYTYAMFGQIPETLEDVWINVVKNKMDAAERLISEAKIDENPFIEKYDMRRMKAIDWETCAKVLRETDKIRCLREPW